MIKVITIQGKRLVRVALERILQENDQIELVAQANNGEEGIQFARDLNPDVIIIDIIISKGITGIEVIRKLQSSMPDIKILVIASHNNLIFIHHALKTGAYGYLTQRTTPKELFSAIKSVSLGKQYISNEVGQKLALQKLSKKERNPLLLLSVREIEILLQIMLGSSVKTIAKQLFITPKTVNAYRYMIFSKLKVHNDVQLLWTAFKNGLEEFF